MSDAEAAIKERLAYPFGDVEFEKEYLAIQTEIDPKPWSLFFHIMFCSGKIKTIKH